MRETIIYGGAFNPPTVAHQEIAQAAADYAECIDADLWLLPSGQRRDKEIATPVETRLAYANGLLASLCTKITTKVCDIELNSSELTETCESVELLNREYPDRRFRWIFGSDSVNSMSSWRGGEELLNTLPLLVVDRPGYPLVYEMTNAVKLAVNPTDISSTEVRKRLSMGCSVEGLVPHCVLSFIENNFDPTF